LPKQPSSPAKTTGRPSFSAEIGRNRRHPVLAGYVLGLVEGLAVLLGLLLGLLHVLLRVAEVAHEDEALGALVHDVFDRGDGGDDAGVVLHLAVLHGDVEVDAHDDALALELDVPDRLDHALPPFTEVTEREGK
jgi:hypothetical protein